MHELKKESDHQSRANERIMLCMQYPTKDFALSSNVTVRRRTQFDIYRPDDY